MNVYPEYISVLNSDGSIDKVPYRDVKKHEEAIIEDNIGYGILHGEYSEKEIDDYEREAYAQLRELKARIRRNPDVVLKLDEVTERYVVAEDGAEKTN